jgi:hypothetical protein
MDGRVSLDVCAYVRVHTYVRTWTWPMHTYDYDNGGIGHVSPLRRALLDTLN